MPNADTVARLLRDLEQGRSEAFDELFAVIYDELRSLARLQRRRFTGHETMNTTALVHEAYIKLGARPDASWSSKAHFLAAAAKAVRHILLNYARDRSARKRGGEWRRASFDGSAIPAPVGATGESAWPETLIALDQALDRLADHSDRLGRIVECRFYGGMSIEQTAVALNVSTATVTRGWATARAWLHRELAARPERSVG